MLNHRPSAARAALLAFLVVCIAGCGRRLLPGGELRGVTSEVVATAERVTSHHARISIRPQLEPSWYGGGERLVADDIDIALENPSQAGALADAFAQIARRHHLSFSETSSPGAQRFAFSYRGAPTHSIRVFLPESPSARAQAPAQGSSGVPRLAIIIDDLGGDPVAAASVIALPFPLTASVMPNLPFSAHVADEAYRHGDHVMLHLPMEPDSESAPGGAQPEAVELRVGMSSAQVDSILADMLATVPHAGGVNNHEGSRATADPALMRALMQAIRGRGLYFIDSRTTAATVAYDSAESAGVPAASRKVFLDDMPSRKAILAQLDLAARDARRDGSAIAIGHPRPATVAALAQGVPKLRAAGVRLVFASDLVH